MSDGGDRFGWVGAWIDQKYLVEALVGEGGFGIVYRARHPGFGEPVAIKCLKMPEGADEAARRRFLTTFLAEGRHLHRLSRATAGIVQALDLGAAISPYGIWTPYLVLEWLHGETLESELAARSANRLGGRGLLDAVAILDPAARALDIAHGEGIAHRDVKPSNLYLAELAGRRTLKVLDFGIAKVMCDPAGLGAAGNLTGLGVRPFTTYYGAPEQFDPRFGPTGPWTDVFALALVLVEVASGQRAFAGDDGTQHYLQSVDETRRRSLRELGVAAPNEVERVARSRARDRPAQSVPACRGVLGRALVRGRG